jgi:Uncharacterized vancomycin resistance protein
MDPEVQTGTRKQGKKNIIVISLVVLSLLLLAISAQFIYMVLKQGKVYKGVYINQLSVSGMTRQELENSLNQNFQDKIKDLEITVQTDKINKKTSFSDLKVSYGMDEAVDSALAVGREGNIFKRLYEIFNAGTKGVHIPMPLSYDKDKAAAFVDNFYKETLIDVKEADILIQQDKVTIRSGHHGEHIEKEAISTQVKQMINECRGGVIKVTPEITEPSKINIDELYTQLNKEPVDAAFKVENGTARIEPHVVGMKVDKATLDTVATELEKAEDTEKTIPIETIQPAITTEKANAMLFKDQLAYMSTHFSTGTTNDKNRGENMKLAVAKINGRILIPGEVFSFNDTVGPRTEEGGYQKAHTYSAGKVVDGIGGGICQVSSTLYGAVLKSDLEVLERRNHMFTVGYVPYGQDATVSFGSQDFKFRNSTKWPLKIEAGITKDNRVYFNFIGTNETPGKKVIITQQIIKKLPYTIKYIDDTTLTQGSTKVKQEGKEGYIVDTFKTIKIDGKVISEVKLHTSKYNPLVEEILRGTKKPATGTSPTVKPTLAPTPTPTPLEQNQEQTNAPVDDADNPPAQ